jgi:hypothetical protein
MVWKETHKRAHNNKSKQTQRAHPLSQTRNCQHWKLAPPTQPTPKKQPKKTQPKRQAWLVSFQLKCFHHPKGVTIQHTTTTIFKTNQRTNQTHKPNKSQKNQKMKQ